MGHRTFNRFSPACFQLQWAYIDAIYSYSCNYKLIMNILKQETVEENKNKNFGRSSALSLSTILVHYKIDWNIDGLPLKTVGEHNG